MINFFLFPLKSGASRYKYFFKILSVSVIIASAFTFSGCRTLGRNRKSPSLPSNVNIEERLKNAEAVKANLLKQLEHPKNVDETIRIKEHLDKLQDEIDLLKSGKDADTSTTDEEDGFKSVKRKRVLYGPIGMAVEITQWVLEKLWIIHET